MIPTYTQTFSDITVTVEPHYIMEESSPLEGEHFWAYVVRIYNKGAQSVQVRTRLWEIIDEEGITHHVRGEGVVGQQPVIEPGESFEYTSGVPLQTPSAIMKGYYGMMRDDGVVLEIPIPAFSLDNPYTKKVVH